MSSKMPFGGQKLNQNLGHVHTTTLAGWEDNRCNANCSWSAKIGKRMNVNKHQLIKATNEMWISSSTHVGWLPACKQKTSHCMPCIRQGSIYAHGRAYFRCHIKMWLQHLHWLGLIQWNPLFGRENLRGVEEPQHLSWKCWSHWPPAHESWSIDSTTKW